ncbi:MAG: (2Fe-2S)-binding protein [Planctomycetes bacterium]|nr:(2Fe-2S)-binding protein [Planctomycetota bacterium]
MVDRVAARLQSAESQGPIDKEISVPEPTPKPRDEISLTINGRLVRVAESTTVAAAVIGAGFPSFRRSVRHERRGPVCGMGVCFECRLTIDGIVVPTTCQLACREGMVVTTDG